MKCESVCPLRSSSHTAYPSAVALDPGGEVLHVTLCVALHAMDSRGRHDPPGHLHGDGQALQRWARGCRQDWSLRHLAAAESVQQSGERRVGEAGQAGAQERVRLDLYADTKQTKAEHSRFT